VIVVALVLWIIARLRRKRHEKNDSVTETTSEAKPEPESEPESESEPVPESEPDKRDPESGPRPVGSDESADNTDQVSGNS
jgi:cytoskeletal protein RodZ